MSTPTSGATSPSKPIVSGPNKALLAAVVAPTVRPVTAASFNAWSKSSPCATLEAKLPAAAPAPVATAPPAGTPRVGASIGPK